MYESREPAKAATLAPITTGTSAWLDTDGRVHQKLHASQSTLILVRPDGYIGYRCQPADGEALMKYLDGYLVRKG